MDLGGFLREGVGFRVGDRVTSHEPGQEEKMERSSFL